jgi:hypothetical protein
VIRKLILLSACVCALFIRCRAETYRYEYSPGCRAAYDAYLALRPDEGDAIIRNELLAHPGNLLSYYIADYGDFLTLLFNGDPGQRKERAAHESERLSRLEAGPDNDPWKRLALAGVHLHWALIRIRFGEQFHAATTFRRSYLLLKENASKFPQFAPNNVLLGAEEAVAGTIPDQYNWLMKIFGMKGNLKHGMARLGGFVKAQPRTAPLYDEARIFHLYLRFYLGHEKSEAWQTASDEDLFPVHNELLHAFVRTNLALSYRKADIALATLQIAFATPGAAAYPAFDYEMGITQLMRLDPAAGAYLDRFVSRNTGTIFTKDALQKAAFSAYLHGNVSKAAAYRASISKKGSSRTDADRQAQRFGTESAWPHPLLLTVRMLIDGGYCQQALTKLRSTSPAAFSTVPDQLEYEFRMGRALEDCGDINAALQTFNRVLQKGRTRSEHFAARAALQMGGIYEQYRNFGEARKFYQTCLDLPEHDFQSSIDQQAKAGLARMAE